MTPDGPPHNEAEAGPGNLTAPGADTETQPCASPPSAIGGRSVSCDREMRQGSGRPGHVVSLRTRRSGGDCRNCAAAAQ